MTQLLQGPGDRVYPALHNRTAAAAAMVDEQATECGAVLGPFSLISSLIGAFSLTLRLSFSALSPILALSFCEK